MPIIPLQFTRGSHEARSKNATSEKLTNVFVEKPAPNEDFPDVVYGSVGLREFCDTETNQPVWGLGFLGEYMYAVSGNKAFIIGEAGNCTELIGTLATLSTPCQVETNGTSVAILDNAGSLYNATTTAVTQVTDPAYFDANSMTVLDGYGIFDKKDTTTFFISDIDNFTTYPGDAEIARKTPTPIVRVFSDLGELWIYKQDVTQVYRNTGNTDFPFQLLTGSILQRGSGAKLAHANDSNTKFWLGDDRLFYKAFGYAPQMISDGYIAEQVRDMDVVSDAFAFTYTVGKNKFYTVTFPSEMRTFEYNILTNEWNDRKSFGIDRWRVNCYIKAWKNKQYVGDYLNGKIYELDLDTYDEAGSPIVREAITANIGSVAVPMTFMSLWVDFEAGVGLTTGQGSDPEARLSWSDDGGKTWSNEYTRKIGAIGNYETRVVWRGLGQSRNRCFKIQISDPVKYAIKGAYIEVEMGDE